MSYHRYLNEGSGGGIGIRTLGRLAPTTVFEIESGGAIRLLLMLGCVVLLGFNVKCAPDNATLYCLVIISSLANWLAEILHSEAVNL